ncbi:hypothetical protein EGW08_000059 [Elysia chlorotica]|uniref:protein-tyrosine-phosphatase n=1 Tax=Elysia chlorotica TaxID=188477 RepID=A0A3S1BVI4_ELYCH|nr:hypothetical protein EGW08_000059 [Elysia chlorotica]
MCSVHFITALAALAALAPNSGCRAQSTCTTNGWFGPNCKYQCHCAGSASCDKVDGSCSSGCHPDWFGPACQYRRMTFSFTGGSWLTDTDDTTCNPWSTQSVTVTLDTPIPLTWVRLVVNDPEHLDQIQLSYQPSGSATQHNCPDLRKATIGSMTVDIPCPTENKINEVTLYGSGVTGLCSLYISGGRNVALKQAAYQSSHYTDAGRYTAYNAVDGTIYKGSASTTCSHTEPYTAAAGWWRVIFSQTVKITWFLIYNRDEWCCRDRLRRFTLTAQPESSTNTPYKYTDPGGTAQAIYTVVPSPRISFPVKQVSFVSASSDKIMTLCEVFAFGEIDCAVGRYGLRCEGQCNCADQASCFVHSGGCPSGCATGFTGETCSDCLPGRYGDGCDKFCNAACGGDNSCVRSDGTCSQGCDPGYTGRFCDTKCPTGRYDQDCSESCSSTCGGPDNACDHVNGTCTDGCDDGYQGHMCDKECEVGRYGAGCGESCSVHCAGSKNTCDHVTGHCDQGCDPGFQSLKCEEECPTGRYGQDCSESCSSTCGGPDNACDHVNGTCTDGCDDGYQGNMCDTECEVGRYGADCGESCSVHCAGSNNTCDHVTGHCDQGCDPNYESSKCEQAIGDAGGSGGGDGIIPVVIGVVVAVLVIAVVVAVFITWKRRWNRPKQQDSENGVDSNRKTGRHVFPLSKIHKSRSTNKNSSSKPVQILPAMINGGYEDSSEEEMDKDMQSHTYTNVLTGNTAVPVETLKTYILEHSADSHFHDQFSSIPMANSSPQTVGLAPENTKKNRYKNILPYDESRVKLQADHSKGQSDYINASFVKGYGEDSFIASQGPSDFILNDFVRMLWEQNVDRVVMLTNLVELGKRRCSMYWPSSGEEEFGEVTVKLLTTHVFAEYTIRHLRLSQSGKPARDVTQFHFTAWPDKSVPESPWGLVDFHQRVMSVPGAGPILVHCSAGVGRTGTFIGLCNLLREAEVTGKMDFRSTLWRLRQDRMHTIQTVAQYAYLHKAALVGLTVAGSTIQVKDMSAKLAALEGDKGDHSSARSYRHEFEAVVSACAATVSQSDAPDAPEAPEAEIVYQNNSALSDTRKDRLSDILPNPTFRPVLVAQVHKEDTYINAVLVPSLTQTSQDIVTQLPLPSTVTDFWRLVTQFNVGLVVAFDLDLASSDQSIGEFCRRARSNPLRTRATWWRRVPSQRAGWSRSIRSPSTRGPCQGQTTRSLR